MTLSSSRYEKMAYRRCGRSGLLLPAVSLGLWHNFGGVDVHETARAMVLRAFDLGITHFDLANNYGPPPGSAEETFGRILQSDLAGSATNWWFPQRPATGCGRVRMATSAPASSCSRAYNLFNRQVEDGLSDVLLESGIGCIAFCPLAQALLTARYLHGIEPGSRVSKPHGFLKADQISGEKLRRIRALSQIAEGRGQSLAQLSLAWLLSRPAVTSVLIGASRVAQIEENVAALENIVFSDGELAAIDAACLL